MSIFAPVLSNFMKIQMIIDNATQRIME